MDELAGKVALITGGAGGLGMGLAQAFVDERMSVVIADINEEGLERALDVFSGSGAEVIAVHADITDGDSMLRLRSAAYDRFGTVHVLCNNAMVGGGGPLAEPIDVGTWESVMAGCVYHVLHGLNAFLPRMIEQGSGHIVNTASRQGLVPSWTLGAYPAAKAALISLSEMLHDEFLEQRLPVGVTVLTPGGIRTAGLVSTVAATAHGDPVQHALLAPRLAAAVEPLDLGRLVVRAIKLGTFYVNSHRETLTWLQQRVDRMVADADRLGTLR
jgi:NAD(P)-dependent dehydrogenase (short-subunit alcohol dehydrogenase family)